MSLRFSLLVTGTLALAATVFAQTPATNRPIPPAPPRADAPGTPINPQQATPAQAGGTGTQAMPDATKPATPAMEPAAAAVALRELNFAEADTDHDKKVSLTEFANYVGNRPANKSTDPLTEESIERFRQLDRDNDAFLSESEATAPSQPEQPVVPATRPRR
jgi:protein-disulfide isomerase